MKSIPFNSSFIIDSFIATIDVIDKGYYPLSLIPEIESVTMIVGEVNDIIFPQFNIMIVDSDTQSLFNDQSIGSYVLTWFMGSVSSSSSECFIPDPIWKLYGNVYSILADNINGLVQIRYISS